MTLTIDIDLPADLARLQLPEAVAARRAVVASESMQPQAAAEIFRTFAVMFNRLPVRRRSRMEDMIRRSLSALGEHVLTAELNTALIDLVRELNLAGRPDVAAEVRRACEKLSASVGKLGSRATRVSEGC